MICALAPKDSHPSHMPDTFSRPCVQLYTHRKEILRGRGYIEPTVFCLTSPPASVTVEMVAVPQSTVIVGLILGLGPRDGEGGLASSQGAREPGRDPWDPVAGTTY